MLRISKANILLILSIFRIIASSIHWNRTHGGGNTFADEAL